jgi:hypothetical protein
MKDHKLPQSIIDSLTENNNKIQLLENNSNIVKLNLAQNQINLLQILANIEKSKSFNEGLIEGFAISKELDVKNIALSEDGLSIVETHENNN